MDNNYWKEYWDSYYKFMDFYINKLQNIYPNEDIEERYTEVAKQFEPSIRPKGYIPPIIRPGCQWICPGTPQGNQGQGMGQGTGQGTQQGNQGQGMGQGTGQGTQQGNQVQGMGQGTGQGTQQGNQGQGMGQGTGQGTQQGNQVQGMGQGTGQGTQQGNQGQGMGQGTQQGNQGQGMGQVTQQGNQGQGIQQGIQGPGPAISPGCGQFTLNNCRRMAIVRVVMRVGFNPSNFYMVVENSDRRSIQGYRIDCNEGRIRFVAMSVEYRNINFIECVF